jgi:hypothetical protein
MTDGSYTVPGRGQNPADDDQGMDAYVKILGNLEATNAPDNQEFKEDHIGELAPILKQSELLFTRETLPTAYHFAEQPRGDVYSKEFDPITRRYNAIDAPLKTEELTYPGKLTSLRRLPSTTASLATSTCIPSDIHPGTLATIIASARSTTTMTDGPHNLVDDDDRMTGSWNAEQY